MKLSILIAGLYERLENNDLLKTIYEQADGLGNDVEVLYLMDDGTMSVGRKRNILLSIARGRYFAFIDDDDMVSSDYVSVLLDAIGKANGADVIVFRQDCIHADTGEVEHCEYGLGYEYTKTGDQWRGKPAHTMAWRTDVVQDVEFPDGNFGEDVGWVAGACKRAVTEYRLDSTLYTYRFDPAKSRTRG